MIQIIKVIISYAMIVIISRAYAEVIEVPVEIACGKSPSEAIWTVYEGAPEYQYTLTTRGLRVDNDKDIKLTHRGDFVGCKTENDLRVFVAAECLPGSSDSSNISASGDSFSCGIGEGLRVKMYEPFNEDPDKYHYVATLTKTRIEKDEQAERNILEEGSLKSALLLFSVNSLLL